MYSTLSTIHKSQLNSISVFLSVGQLNRMPPDACSEFSFSRKGQLIFSASVPPSCGSSVRSNGTGLSSSASVHSSKQLQMWLQVAAKVVRKSHFLHPLSFHNLSFYLFIYLFINF